MITSAKLAANRRNAQLSAGPKTPEGRARSAQNAMKHGLFAKAPVLPTENPEEYQAMRQQYLQELQPQGTLETELVERVINAVWRMRRFGPIEAEILAIEFHRIEEGVEENRLGLAFLRRENATHAIARLYRYEMSLERSFYRALKELARLKAAKKSAGTNPRPADLQQIEGPTQMDSGGQPRAEGFTQRLDDCVSAEIRQDTKASQNPDPGR